MSNAPQSPLPPSPLHFVAEVFYGATMGFLPAFLIFLTAYTGIPEALGIMTIVVVFGTVYHLTGWVLITAPFHLLRWCWRKLTGQPNPAPQPAPARKPAPPRHWAERAGFWSGFALINLLALRACMNMYRGLA